MLFIFFKIFKKYLKELINRLREFSEYIDNLVKRVFGYV